MFRQKINPGDCVRHKRCRRLEMSAGDFREDVTYDPNGNILTYRRAGGNSADLLMDNLTYHYDSDNNKLNYISDAQTNTSAYTGDLEDQPSYNYDYDEIGNLSFDANGGLLVSPRRTTPAADRASSFAAAILRSG